MTNTDDFLCEGDDRYPTDTELDIISQWPWQGTRGCFVKVRSLWRYADDGYWHERGRVFRLHTGGWSGNESLIGALQENRMIWMLTWQSSRRGGHYTFAIPEDLFAKPLVEGIAR